MPSILKRSEENNTIETVIRNDTVRYVRKGYGLIVSILLNLIFFFAIPAILTALWPYYLALAPKKVLMFFTTISIHSGVFIFGNVVMWFIYVKKLPVFEKDRISPKVLWPWEERDQTKWKTMRMRSLKILLHHHFILTPVLLILDLTFGKMEFNFDLESIPSVFEIAFQILCFMISDDFFFFLGHKLLHHPRLYPHIHKLHHEHYHPMAFSAEYDHWIEFTLGSASQIFLPKMLGGRVHMMTLMMWIICRTFEVLDDHCGYEFSWSPFRLVPFSGSAAYHDYHHTHNDGCYGTFFTFWDTIMGWNQNYYRYLAIKEKKNAPAPPVNPEENEKQHKLHREEFLSLDSLMLDKKLD